MSEEKALVIGAGPVGSLLSLYLARRGVQVCLTERRPDYRSTGLHGGRSINFALTERGRHALRQIGLEEEVLKAGVPMHGRIMHNLQGQTTFQPYGKEGQSIYSVSRNALNLKLVNLAGTYPGLDLRFNARCTGVDFASNSASFLDSQSNEPFTLTADLIYGADGAFSKVRRTMQKTDRFNFSQHYIEHGYKEFTLPAGAENSFQMEPNGLHIWPRGNFMMIALPNPDGSFTCTLFFPFEGPVSFASIKTEAEAKQFLESSFPDLYELIPELESAFFKSPLSSLVTIHCNPWSRANTMLIGDSAHAIVPFFGQGMNAGFEDIYLLDQFAEANGGSFSGIYKRFQKERRPDADAISELAMNNFIEMRDLVADPRFLLRKKIEARLHELFPEKWIPLYTQVTFSRVPYRQALESGKKQDVAMEKMMALPDIETRWTEPGFLEKAFELIGL